MRSTRSMKILQASSLIAIFLITSMMAIACQAQPPKFKKPSFGKTPAFGKKTTAKSGALAEFSAEAIFKARVNTETGVLEVHCDIPEGSHLFSVTQKKAVPGPLKTRIRVDDSDQFKLTGDFQPDKDPHLVPIPGQKVKSEEHEGKVVFSAPIEFAKGVKPDDVTINVKLNGQVCTDAGSCMQIQEKLVAKYDGVLTSIPAGAKFSPADQHLLLHGSVSKIDNGAVSDTPVEPGDKVRIVITAEPQDDYHIYAYSDDLTKSGSATFLAITKTGGWSFSGPSMTTFQSQILNSI